MSSGITKLSYSEELTLRGIDPRREKNRVIHIVSKFLDDCDPDNRPIITLTNIHWEKDNGS